MAFKPKYLPKERIYILGCGFPYVPQSYKTRNGERSHSHGRHHKVICTSSSACQCKNRFGSLLAKSQLLIIVAQSRPRHLRLILYMREPSRIKSCFSKGTGKRHLNLTMQKMLVEQYCSSDMLST